MVHRHYSHGVAASLKGPRRQKLQSAACAAATLPGPTRARAVMTSAYPALPRSSSQPDIIHSSAAIVTSISFTVVPTMTATRSGMLLGLQLLIQNGFAGTTQ